MVDRGQQFEILLVDDNDNDALILREGLAETDMDCRLTVAKDGETALRRLRKESEFSDVKHPDLILLDLHLPRKDGQSVLSEIKSDADLRHIPVVVWSTSIEPQEVDRCYRLHANSVLVKPDRFAGLVDSLRTVGRYWFGAVALPSGAKRNQ